MTGSRGVMRVQTIGYMQSINSTTMQYDKQRMLWNVLQHGYDKWHIAHVAVRRALAFGFGFLVCRARVTSRARASAHAYMYACGYVRAGGG